MNRTLLGRAPWRPGVVTAVTPGGHSIGSVPTVRIAKVIAPHGAPALT